MRRLAPALIFILALCAAVPVAAGAAEGNWRQRLSAGDEVAASDITAEVRFGREVAARIAGKYGLYQDAALTKYVNLVGQVLVLSANRPEIEFHFAVLNTDEINAYAAPGGYIFVTRGAIARMEDESELAGVLAHEIGHVVEKHVVRELNIHGTDDSAMSGFARAIGGSTDAARLAFSQAVDQALDILFKDGYKREDEKQADRDAVMFCALSGYDPSGLVRYFGHISGIKGKQTEILDRTHPAFDARIAWLKETMESEGIDSAGSKIAKERFTETVKNILK